MSVHTSLCTVDVSVFFDRKDHNDDRDDDDETVDQFTCSFLTQSDVLLWPSLLISVCN